MGTDFEDAPWVWLTMTFPPMEKTSGEKLPEKRANAHAGVEVSAAPNLAGFAGVIAMFRIVESNIEKIGK